jgi:uncharacterized protein (TIGR02145 family)
MAKRIKHIILLYLGLLAALQASGQISMPDTVCEGDLKHYWVDPTPGSTYTWKINGVVQSSVTNEIWIQWNAPWIPSGGPYALTVQEQSLTGCFGPVKSGMVVVRPLIPVGVAIVADQNPVCPGTLVTFNATPVNGGTTPVYQWRVNGGPEGTNSPSFAYVPSDGDIVTCTIISNVSCPSGNPAVSNTVLMDVGPMPVTVSISASSNNVCQGTLITFTAIPVNGGVTPLFHWKVNGLPAGSNSSTYSYAPVNNDVVTCVLTSDLLCATGNPATSNPLTMTIRPIPYVELTICNDITTRYARAFTLKGGVPPGGIYSGTGVTGGIFDPSLLPPMEDTALVSYTVTNSFGCKDSRDHIITVYPSISFICGNKYTDVRDGKVYNTITVGSQCWLASNLNFGQQTMASAIQRDNCVSEKYCYNDLPGSCSTHGGLYQWDEVMQFEEIEEVQGLCPPEWHIPDETEWNILFAFCGGNGFAGDMLRTGGSTGFDALLTGGRFMNKKWDLDESAFFWSSTAQGPFKAWAHSLNSINHGVSYYPSSRANALSVRCLKD